MMNIFALFFQMRVHSIENRARGELRKQKTTDCNLQSGQAFFPKQRAQTPTQLRRCESSSTLAKTSHELFSIETKYKALEQDYRRILKQVKSKVELFSHQKEEIEKLNKITQREEKQIARLRDMLRMVPKQSIAIQTEQPYHPYAYKAMETCGVQSQLTSETRDERKSGGKSISGKSVSNNRPEIRKVPLNSTLNRDTGRQKAPLSKKYKFVPSLLFKHL